MHLPSPLPQIRSWYRPGIPRRGPLLVVTESPGGPAPAHPSRPRDRRPRGTGGRERPWRGPAAPERPPRAGKATSCGSCGSATARRRLSSWSWCRPVSAPLGPGCWLRRGWSCGKGCLVFPGVTQVHQCLLVSEAWGLLHPPICDALSPSERPCTTSLPFPVRALLRAQSWTQLLLVQLAALLAPLGP